MSTKKHTIYISTKDYFKSGENFDLVYDTTREFLTTSPQPSLENLAGYYDSDEYISHTDTKKGLLPFLYNTVKKRSLKKKINLVFKLSKSKGDLLDIGAGTGSFCEIAKNQSWNVFGVEPNEKARTIALKRTIDLLPSIDDFNDRQFDVITLWHVLEHLPNLEETICKIESLLKPGGHLIIAVPNFKSFDAKHYKEFWAAFDVPRHLWHFSQKSMKLLFSEKLILIKTKPMIFDSFYVSLLSEKYKSGKHFSLKALCIGFWSNLVAIISGEYSSLIYCYKKQN